MEHTGKNHFPWRRSSVYTESGKPFPAALTHILWKWRGWKRAVPKPGASWKPWEQNSMDQPPAGNAQPDHPCAPTPNLLLLSLLADVQIAVCVTFPGIKDGMQRTSQLSLGANISPEGVRCSS